MRTDRLIRCRGTAIVQQAVADAHSHSGAAHFTRTGIGLRDAIAERAHVVQQQVGVEVDRLPVQRRDRVKRRSSSSVDGTPHNPPAQTRWRPAA